MRKTRMLLAGVSGIVAAALATSGANAVDLKDAVQTAVASNPEINQAVSNREATEYERRQAQGLYGPRLNVEASAGVRELDNPTRRALGIANGTLWPVELDATVDQLVTDFGKSRNEVARQAARTDAAALRVEERSEFVALNVSRYYFDYLLQQRIVAAAQDNVTFHERLVGDLGQGVRQGSISIADQQQAEERLQAARAKLTQANEDLENADIAFRQVSGVGIGQPTMPPDFSAQAPATLDEAIDAARVNHPRVREAMADVDAAKANAKKEEDALAPRISVEGRFRTGKDMDGFQGRTDDYQARVVLRWTPFDSGIQHFVWREMQRREGEARGRVNEMARQAEADARSAWVRRENQHKLVGELEQQSKVSDDLILSYREQFNVGRRSLLDLLDAQNTRYNVQVQVETARFAELYAQYRLLASTNRLLAALGVAPPAGAKANNRARFKVKPVPITSVLEPRSAQ